MAEEITAKVMQLENPEADYETLKKEMEANSKANEDDVELNADEVILRTQFLNLSRFNISRIDRHFWSGSAVTDSPYLPSGGSYAVLTQKGTIRDGVKWGQVWGSGPADDTSARKWVVAIDSVAGKVYAEAGPMGPVDWNVIEVKLGLSGSDVDYKDPILGGQSVVTISGLKVYAHFR